MNVGCIVKSWQTQTYRTLSLLSKDMAELEENYDHFRLLRVFLANIIHVNKSLGGSLGEAKETLGTKSKSFF
jgi:hypothetical protein